MKVQEVMAALGSIIAVLAGLLVLLAIFDLKGILLIIGGVIALVVAVGLTLNSLKDRG